MVVILIEVIGGWDILRICSLGRHNSLILYRYSRLGLRDKVIGCGPVGTFVALALIILSGQYVFQWSAALRVLLSAITLSRERLQIP